MTTRYAEVTVEQADTGTQKIGVRVNNWISRLAAWLALMGFFFLVDYSLTPILTGKPLEIDRFSLGTLKVLGQAGQVGERSYSQSHSG